MKNASPSARLVLTFKAILGISGLSAALIGVANPAYAYIDPNASGLLFQILTPILGAVALGWFTLRQWFARHLRAAHDLITALLQRK